MTAEKKMVRKAADNKYLHKDFHNIMNIGLIYIEKKYGIKAVDEYLRQFTNVYYAPLKEKINANGIDTLEEYFKDIYDKEEWSEYISFEKSEDALIVKIAKCPAVSHIKKSGDSTFGQYSKTTQVVYETVCEGTTFDFEMLNYNKDNGAAELVFYRRQANI